MRHRLTLLLICWSSLLLAQDDGALSVRIELPEREELEFGQPFRVVFTNDSDEAIRIWTPNSMHASDQITFEFEDVESSQKHSVRRHGLSADGTWNFLGRPIPYEREPVLLPPHKNHVTMIVFSSDWSGLPEPNRGRRYHVTANFQSKPSEVVDDPPIWEGRVQSKPVTISFTTTSLTTPQDWLIHGFSENAIELMQADPKLVKSRDKVMGTPLQAAAKGKALEALRWLLNNDGDWEAKRVDYREFLVDDYDPEVIALILTKKPNLDQRASNSKKSILHRVAYNFAFSNNSKDKEKWLKIANMYIEAGATYDLESAIYLDDLTKVREILSNDPSKAAKPQYRPSPLWDAASAGRLEICRFLIDRFGIDRDELQSGQIFVAGIRYPSIVKLLIEHGADPTVRISHGARFGKWIIENDATLLHYAARDGVPETINLLLNLGVDITAVTEENAKVFGSFPTSRELPFRQTALNLAALYGAVENATAMIQHTAFLELEKPVRQRMLDEALITGAFNYLFRYLNDEKRPELVQLLIDAGANPNASIDGESVIPPDLERLLCLKHSSQSDDSQMIQLLRQHGAEIDILTAIAIGDNEEVARQLNADPKLANARSPQGCPALHYAVICNSVEIVKLLVEAGADPKAANMDPEFLDVGLTAVGLAKELEYEELVKFLEQAEKQN